MRVSAGAAGSLCLYLCKAFDLVNQDSFWRILGLHGEFVRGVCWPPHFSVLVRTGFWGGCRRDQAAVHRFGMSRSLTLTSQMMQSSFRRPWISFWGPGVLNLASEPLGLRVSCVKTKIQAITDILDAAILSVPV